MFGTLKMLPLYIPSDCRSKYSEQYPQQERKAARKAETERKQRRKKKKTVKIAAKTDKRNHFALPSSDGFPSCRNDKECLTRFLLGIQ